MLIAAFNGIPDAALISPAGSWRHGLRRDHRTIVRDVGRRGCRYAPIRGPRPTRQTDGV